MKTESIILLGLLSQTPIWADTLLSDNFSDGSRANRSLPNSAQWFAGGATANTYVTNNNALVVSGLTGSGLGGQGVLASFESPGTELNLTVGETLTLKFNYYYAATSSTDFGLGFGFYNSASSPLTADNKGFNNSLFNAWKGYSAFGIFGGTDSSSYGRFHVAQRVTTANNLLSPFQTGVLGSTHQTDGLQANTWYAASLTLNYVSSTSLVLTATIGGESLVATTTPAVTSFDSVAITDGGQAVGSMGVSDVVVVATAANLVPVPEPSVAALVGAGCGLLGLARWHRSRRG